MMTRELFDAQLEALHAQLLNMGEQVQGAIAGAVDVLVARDAVGAKAVIVGDEQVNQLTLKIEGLCLEMLALQQPMARDLRRITSILKVITDLERIADHAVDIARATERLSGQSFVKPLVDIPQMAALVQGMVATALNAFVARNREQALSLVEQDHEVDRLHRQVIEDLQRLMEGDSRAISQGIQLLFVSSALERIGDHATNLGEWYLYLETGDRTDLNQ
jgi:phosphate transport system protein